jgi:predicted  nucleic acid-binding Zn-ribbon protein
MSAIENFLKRYDAAFKANSKELRLQAKEARDLAHEVSLLSIRQKELADEVVRLQAKIIKLLEKQPSGGSIELDGGQF